MYVVISTNVQRLENQRQEVIGDRQALSSWRTLGALDPSHDSLQ